MKVLVTGAKGFVGKNLVEGLKNIKFGKDRTRSFSISEIFEYDRDSTKDQLEFYCKEADFVFNLAGVNRPKNEKDFFEGNFGFASELLSTLKKFNNKAPVMISSSIQACLSGKYKNSVYGESKLAGEKLIQQYGKEVGSRVLIYRFQNLFGKWSKPNYNSVVATFCHNIANNLPINIQDEQIELELVYIDDLLEEMYRALIGGESRCDFKECEIVQNPNGEHCFVPISHKVTLGYLAGKLFEFSNQPKTLIIPEIADNSFEKKLYSTFLSYLPKEKTSFFLKSNVDERGSFTELLKTKKTGQFSVNVSKPGITKGQHWHNSKWEFFIVVSGKALIEMRKIGSNEIRRFEVSGEKFEAVHMLPGFTHNIINLSETDDLITLMWANELFNPEKPDTFFEEV